MKTMKTMLAAETTLLGLPRRAVCLVLMLVFVRTSALTSCPTAFFNFGDSSTDTGSLENALPFFDDPTFPSYGTTFFGEPAKRFSDGRLIIDFFALAFKTPLLQPYIQAGPFDYRHGVNFAVGGATASNDSSLVSFFLPVQISQFIKFKSNTERVRRQRGSCMPFQKLLPSRSAFENGLYTLKFGGNDILLPLLLRNSTVIQIMDVGIPAAMSNYEIAVKTLYGHGARRFLITDLAVLGVACSPILISNYLGQPLDRRGCLIFLNDVLVSFNAALFRVIETLRTDLTGASIAFFNSSAVAEEIEFNLAKYGFNPQLARRVCCGAPGGPVDNNYNSEAKCGRPNSTVCSNINEYISWDGVHGTESYDRVVAKFVLEGKYTEPSINYTSLCNLDYSNFGSSITFADVYDNTCKVTFSS